jgi:hypothetical protein
VKGFTASDLYYSSHMHLGPRGTYHFARTVLNRFTQFTATLVMYTYISKIVSFSLHAVTRLIGGLDPAKSLNITFDVGMRH